MSERSDAIKYGANPAVIDKYFIEFHGRLFHKFCCCGCGSRVGKGSAVIKDTTFIFKDMQHVIHWIAENTEHIGDSHFIKGTTFVFEDEDHFQQWMLDDIEILMGDWGWMSRMAYKAHSKLIIWLQNDRNAWAVVVVALVVVCYVGFS